MRTCIFTSHLALIFRAKTNTPPDTQFDLLHPLNTDTIPTGSPRRNSRFHPCINLVLSLLNLGLQPQAIHQPHQNKHQHQVQMRLLLLIDHPLAHARIHEQVHQRAPHARRDHGISHPFQNRIQPLVHRQERSAAPADGSAHDGSEEGEGEEGGGDGGIGGEGECQDHFRSYAFVQYDDARLNPRNESNDLPNDRKVIVNRKRYQNGNGIRIVRDRDGDLIDEERNEDSAAGAGEDHADEFVREGRILGCRGEYFAAMQEGVSQHAHVQHRRLMHEEEIGDVVVDHPRRRIDYRFDYFGLSHRGNIGGLMSSISTLRLKRRK
mmetsp:Transcript_26588/g.55541  ORF Transcript_26588/g.55541 Transcript_26588/m.55541 type:complete len:322 (-) Transcript_26588:500-1465(-)